VPDQQVIEVTVQHALEFKPLGEAANWSNPNTGNSGAVMPTRTYQNANGQTCREFQQAAGQDAPTSASACRDAAGVWQVGAG
jgi:surface antigen